MSEPIIKIIRNVILDEHNYTAPVICRNCCRKSYALLPKGEEMKNTYLKGTKCTFCETDSLLYFDLIQQAAMG